MSRRLLANLWAAALAAASVGAPAAASAAEPQPASSTPGAAADSPAELPAVAFLPTLVIDGGAKHLPTSREPELLTTTSGLDALLADAAQDLGFTVDLTYRAPADLERLGEVELVAQAKAMGGVLLSPSLEVRSGAEVELRLALADARSRTLRLRVERVARDDLAVRAVVMLRDLMSEIGASQLDHRDRPDVSRGAPAGVLARPAQSAGRATLAVNATLFGGLVGFSIHRSSSGEDPRLLYPLLAVGAGVGLGGAIIIAEEWDVGVGDAWYLVSGGWWPTIAGHLIFEGRFGDVTGGTALSDERWAFGLIGGTAGITLATLGLTVRGMSEGGALLAHSGGGLGLVLGGIAELAVRGDIYSVPFAGMGYGAGLGWLAAASAAVIVRPSPSRVLSVDLGAIVGGLGGAALASPLLFDEPTPGQQRAWLAATAGGSLVGAGVAWYMTRAPRAPSSSLKKAGDGPRSDVASLVGVPLPGILGESAAGGRRAPVLGVSWQGMLP